MWYCSNIIEWFCGIIEMCGFMIKLRFYCRDEWFCGIVEMDMDDLLADLTDDEEDSMAAKAKKPAPKQQKEETTVKKQRSAEDMTPQKSIENEGTALQ